MQNQSNANGRVSFVHSVYTVHSVTSWLPNTQAAPKLFDYLYLNAAHLVNDDLY